MPSTLLNVPGRQVIQAGNNPTQNAMQVQPQQQATTSNANATQGVQAPPMQGNNQGISPITIPIQLQPQVAPVTQPQTANGQNGIATIANGQQQTPNNAPSPQQYQGTQNSNIVSFNDIYSGYQSQYGTNPQNAAGTSSGVKKTTMNTTIVTPTTTNLNSVEGQYQSAFSDSINSLISEMLSRLSNGFEYDPTQDTALQMASEYAANSTLQSLAGSGVLNSTATAERVARIVSELIPTYEDKAYGRYMDYLNQLANTAQTVMSYDAQQFSYWKDAKDREFQNKQFEYQKQQDALDNAWKRVDELGYVDNEASQLLGVPVGTLSAEARLAKEQQEFELKKMREQLDIQRANDEALARLKSELDLQTNKALAGYEHELNKDMARLESSLQAQRNREQAQLEHQLDKDMAQYENNLQTQRSKELAQYENQLQKDLAQYESALQTQRSKDLAQYENQLQKDLAQYENALKTQQSKELTEHEYEVAQKYGKISNSSTKSNKSAVEAVLKAKYLSKDATDEYKATYEGNNAAYNYIETQYNNGRITAQEAMDLMDIYGIKTPEEMKLIQQRVAQDFKNYFGMK